MALSGLTRRAYLHALLCSTEAGASQGSITSTKAIYVSTSYPTGH
jgi:hypothetical protein